MGGGLEGGFFSDGRERWIFSGGEGGRFFLGRVNFWVGRGVDFSTGTFPPAPPLVKVLSAFIWFCFNLRS